MRTAVPQEFVTPRRTVSADHIDLPTGIIERRSQVVEQIEQVEIEMMNVSRTMVAEIMVELIHRFR